MGERGPAIRSITAGVFVIADPAVEEARGSPDCTEDAVVDLTGLRGISPAFSAFGIESFFARGVAATRSTGDFGESVESKTLGKSDPVPGDTTSALDKLFLFPDTRPSPSSLGTVLLDASSGNAVAPTVSSATVARA